LIEETCANWARLEQRGSLARMFPIEQCWGASNRSVEKDKNSSPGSQEVQLHSAASAFCQLQGKRHDADYDLLKTLSGSVVELDIDLVEDAIARL
jgi:hypothetical protein